MTSLYPEGVRCQWSDGDGRRAVRASLDEGRARGSRAHRICSVVVQTPSARRSTSDGSETGELRAAHRHDALALAAFVDIGLADGWGS